MKPSDNDIEILFEDNHLLAANKPCGLVTQGSEEHPIGLEELLKEYIKQRDQKPGNVYLHAVHRLDRPVSGIVLFAKTSKALSRLQEAMRGREIEKTYVALVEGIVEKAEDLLEHHLLHDEHKARESVDGKKSSLSYSRVTISNGLSFIKINLHTGRYHQIRAQFSAIGHPVVGDTKYGSRHPYHTDAIALHHVMLKFTHPVTKEPLTIISKDLFIH